MTNDGNDIFKGRRWKKQVESIDVAFDSTMPMGACLICQFRWVQQSLVPLRDLHGTLQHDCTRPNSAQHDHREDHIES